MAAERAENPAASRPAPAPGDRGDGVQAENREPSQRDPVEPSAKWLAEIDSLRHHLQRLDAELPQRVRSQLGTASQSTALELERRLEPLRILVRRARDTVASFGHRLHDLETERRNQRRSLELVLETISKDDPRLDQIEDALAELARESERGSAQIEQKLNAAKIARANLKLGIEEFARGLERLHTWITEEREARTRAVEAVREQTRVDYGRMGAALAALGTRIDEELERQSQRLDDVRRQERTHLETELAAKIAVVRRDHERELQEFRAAQESAMEAQRSEGVALEQELRAVLDALQRAQESDFADLESRALDRLGGIEKLLTEVRDRSDSLQGAADQKVQSVERLVASVERRFESTYRALRRDRLTWRWIFIVAWLALLLLVLFRGGGS